MSPEIRSATGAIFFFGSAFGATPPFSLRTRLPARTTVGLALLAALATSRLPASTPKASTSANFLWASELSMSVLPGEYVDNTLVLPQGAKSGGTLVSLLTLSRESPQQSPSHWFYLTLSQLPGRQK
jgi:hypothetical protein